MLRATLLGAIFAFSFLAQGRTPLPMPQCRAQSGHLQAQSGEVLYFGGPVVSNIKLQIVYWGPGVGSDVQDSLRQFYGALVNSSYIDQLAEYNTTVPASNGSPGTNQKIGRGTVIGETVITPANTSKQLSQSDIEVELEHQLSVHALPPADANTAYMIHFPDGYTISISFGDSCSEWYADHEVYKSAKFGNVFYGIFPCDSGDMSAFSTLTSAASHETAETITDPVAPLANQSLAYPAGWLTSDEQEIADLCTGTSATLKAGSTSFEVQGVWLNSMNNCNSAAGFTSP